MLHTDERSTKVRVQVDLTKTEATLLDLLQHRLSVRSRADLLQQAYGTFLWVVDEMLANRRIISVESDELEQLRKFKELSLPAVQPLLFEHYQYLVTRPEKGRKQAYLKGRNMTVGQLVYTMRANGLNAEEASVDLNLPIEQIREAQAYYQVHHELVEADAEEEKRYLIAQGAQIEPASVSG